MIKTELNKLIKKNKGALLILIAFLLQIILLSTEKYPINAITYAKQANYPELYGVFDGKLNDDKANAIEAKYDEISDADGKLAELRASYMKGETPKQVFLEKSKKLEDLNFEKKLFLEFYQQYSFANENRDARFLLYDNGWQALIGTERINWGAILLVIIFSTVLFSQEYETDMHRILISTKKGNQKLVHAKFMAMLLLILGIALISTVVEVLYLHSKFTLPHGGYPIQSLPIFENSEFKISLWGAYLIISGYRIFGLILISVITMMIIVLGKTSILSLISGLIIFIAPWILPIKHALKYAYTTPSSYLMAQGFLRGSEQRASINVPGMSEGFVSAPIQTQIYFLLAYSLLALILLFAIKSIFISVNARKKPVLRKHSLFLLATICSIMMTACTTKHQSSWQTKPDYNQMQDSRYAEFQDQFIVCYPWLASIDSKTAQTDLLIRDPFYRTDPIQINPVRLFKDQDYLYYLFVQPYEQLLTRLNLKTLETRIIWRDKIDRNESRIEEFYYPLNKKIHVEYSAFFLDGNQLYLSTFSKLEKINIITNKKETISDDFNLALASNGKSLYYITSDNKLHHYSMADGKDSVNEELRMNVFFLHENLIYFTNLNYGNYIFSYDTLSQEISQITNKPSYQYFIENDTLYFVESNTGHLYSQNLSTNEEQLIYSDAYIDTFTKLEGQPLIYINTFGEEFKSFAYILNLETMETKPVLFNENN